MGKVEIYSMDNCPYCEKALKLLRKNDIDYNYYKLNIEFTKEQLALRLGVDIDSKITLPQIFLDNESIGGYNELKICLDAVKMMKYIKENEI